MGVEGSLSGKVTGGAGVKVGVAEVEASLAKSEIEGSLGGKMSIENAYEKGRRNLTIFQTYNSKIANKTKIGPAAEACVVGEKLEMDVVSGSGNIGIGNNVRIGLKIKEYEPNDMNDLTDIGKFLLGTTVQATGNAMFLRVAEMMGFDCYNQSNAGVTVFAGAGANVGSIKVGEKDFSLADMGVGAVESYSLNFQQVMTLK